MWYKQIKKNVLTFLCSFHPQGKKKSPECTSLQQPHCLFSHHLSAAAPLPSKPFTAQQRNSSVKSMIPKPGHHQDLRKLIYAHLHYRSHCLSFTSRENTQSCFISKTFSQMDTWECPSFLSSILSFFPCPPFDVLKGHTSFQLRVNTPWNGKAS